ncbi:Glycerol kinase [Acorus calamus]|uniref:Glycerol kinase n=1 Tax=Acorus calamus TaxID=4465 RepID=A0AAV9FEJ9_ACOCL|nr:Glycerol kinase [Acorus calamus]
MTDCSNASRTLLMNLKTLNWDKPTLDALGIPYEILPKIVLCYTMYTVINYRSTGLCCPSETHFDWASVDTYSDSSTDLCRPSEEHFD